MSKMIAGLAFAVAFSLLAGRARTADAQVVPVQGSGTNAAYDPVSGDYRGVGVVSHLGRMSFAGNVQAVSDFSPEPGVFFAGTFVGSQVFVAANGDQLAADLGGDVVLMIDPSTGLVFGTWLVSWQITGGTGRFAGATGTLEGAAINPPFNPGVTPWPFDWYLSGKLNLAKRR